MNRQLVLEKDYAQLQITGKIPDPKLSIEFSAKKLETPLTWDDLILAEKTKREIEELRGLIF
ncbi:hypothetical protein ACFSYG_17270 [Leeuwenhoekiella polynyae]|uniref:Uncharacterized protein n=1 Tax=Leeuwenhoekiella polynyae TaxID=1550906 RepID=A0A4Q0P6F9_9FLAO|nr:hypothetical protein [Leeuwenhoekiella polynyae]RXG22237.1 hypothetical protein DSM02_1836 [Leeuwenhoekiella polynyae]